MRLLLVEDDLDVANVTQRYLRSWGYEVLHADKAQTALDAAAAFHPDLILLDVGLPDQSGMDIIDPLRSLAPEASIIMLTGERDTRLAVLAVRRGAENYLTKPTDFEALHLALDKAAEISAQRRELTQLRQKADKGYLFLPNAQMLEVYAAVSRVAASEKASVLILGETGAGKQPIARLIHQLSARSGKPFQELHCAALPETLLESELFGYEAGAFTDARKPKPGLFELAQGGTLFLDEVGELPLGMQIKLLKVLEDRQVRRLGSTRSLELDLRLVAATNRDLDAEVAAGRFRSDLLYRLKVFTIQLPPLRGRTDDIEALSRFFHAQFSHESGRRPEPLPAEVLALLRDYAWPGNVRELRNVMERFVIQQGSGLPSLEALPQEIRIGRKSREKGGDGPGELGKGPPVPILPGSAGATPSPLLALLDKHRWNKTKAAAELGVSRPTFLKRLKEAGID